MQLHDQQIIRHSRAARRKNGAAWSVFTTPQAGTWNIQVDRNTPMKKQLLAKLRALFCKKIWSLIFLGQCVTSRWTKTSPWTKLHHENGKALFCKKMLVSYRSWSMCNLHVDRNKPLNKIASWKWKGSVLQENMVSFLVKIGCSIRSFNTANKMYQNATYQIYYLSLAVEMYLFHICERSPVFVYVLANSW